MNLKHNILTLLVGKANKNGTQQGLKPVWVWVLNTLILIIQVSVPVVEVRPSSGFK
jgi:hypothetical protein